MASQDPFIFGIHAVREALRAGKQLERVMVRHGSGSGQVKELLGDLRQAGIPVQRVPVERLNRVTRKNHQGVIAWISAIPFHDITLLLPSIFERGEDPLILILDGISDIRNFGAIARSAEGAGVHAILIPFSGGAATRADAVRTSAGALLRIPVCRHRDLKSAVRFLRESGLRVLAATEKSELTAFQADMAGPLGLVMGSEDQGVSAEILRAADQLISLPMAGQIASLNVSVAAGILLFEAVRQRSAGNRVAGDSPAGDSHPGDT